MTSPVHTVANTWETNRDILSNKTNAWKNKADNPVISSYTYTVNPLGQRTAVTTAGEAFAQSPSDWTWGYDILGQITQANTDRYAYDQIGNRLTSGKNNEALTTYMANALNQYTAINTALPTYDADGNQLTGLSPTGSHPNRASLAFTYNANSRPIEIRQNGDLTDIRTYDHMGRRIRKGSTLTLYDGYNAIAEYNLSTHALKTTYAWGLDLSGTIQGAGGVGGLLCVTEHDKQTPLTSYPCYDGNGNITEYLTEENGGTLAAHYEYDAFGNDIKKTGEREYEYQFSTKPLDSLTDLNYYNYRDYDSVNGRWINRDPIGENGGINLYCFVKNKVHTIDFLGKDESEDCAKCNKYVEQKKKYYSNSIDLLEKAGCHVSFKCTKLDAYGESSAWTSFSKDSILKFDCCRMANQKIDDNKDTFGHELEHAKQRCSGKVKSSCEANICNEIEANLAGGCRGMTNDIDLKSCMLGEVKRSVVDGGHCSDSEFENKFNMQYDSCLSNIPNRPPPY